MKSAILIVHLANIELINHRFDCEITQGITQQLLRTFHFQNPSVIFRQHNALLPSFPVSYGGQGGAIQESCGVFLSCLQTTLAQHGALVFHL